MRLCHLQFFTRCQKVLQLDTARNQRRCGSPSCRRGRITSSQEQVREGLRMKSEILSRCIDDTQNTPRLDPATLPGSRGRSTGCWRIQENHGCTCEVSAPHVRKGCAQGKREQRETGTCRGSDPEETRTKSMRKDVSEAEKISKMPTR